jgi:hypothetical protein
MRMPGVASIPPPWRWVPTKPFYYTRRVYPVRRELLRQRQGYAIQLYFLELGWPEHKAPRGQAARFRSYQEAHGSFGRALVMGTPSGSCSQGVAHDAIESSASGHPLE